MMRLDADALAHRFGIFSACTQYAQEIGAINLSQGLPEPMMDTRLAEVLGTALPEGWQYAPSRGVQRLREGISTRLYPRGLSARDVLVTSGCTEALYVALRALRDSFASS